MTHTVTMLVVGRRPLGHQARPGYAPARSATRDRSKTVHGQIVADPLTFFRNVDMGVVGYEGHRKLHTTVRHFRFRPLVDGTRIAARTITSDRLNRTGWNEGPDFVDQSLTMDDSNYASMALLIYKPSKLRWPPNRTGTLVRMPTKLTTSCESASDRPLYHVSCTDTKLSSSSFPHTLSPSIAGLPITHHGRYAGVGV
ncbi:hypothetical protein L210DRAFT_945593, partial [Boletus edulis BED1]